MHLQCGTIISQGFMLIINNRWCSRASMTLLIRANEQINFDIWTRRYLRYWIVSNTGRTIPNLCQFRIQYARRVLCKLQENYIRFFCPNALVHTCNDSERTLDFWLVLQFIMTSSILKMLLQARLLKVNWPCIVQTECKTNYFKYHRKYLALFNNVYQLLNEFSYLC